MTQGFFQFNNSIINEIVNFATSSYGLFFIYGPEGASKSETIEKIIPELSQNSLVFRHFCFENSVIDDFLLDLYDGLKDFSIAGKLSLKKFTTGDFKEKVTHYFKTIEKNCIIIVENFDKVENNSEIINFLIHLAQFPNVKLIIVSKNENRVFPKLIVKPYQLQQFSKEDFKTKLTTLTQVYDDELKEFFYEITGGLELYLNMGIKYCANTSISLTDLIDEFKRRDDNFEHFIVSKFISLTPVNYRSVFRILSLLSHPVSVEFIEKYKLGNLSYVDYLIKNFLLSRFDEEVYVKDYFKKYIYEGLTLQNKANYYDKLIKIYEKELTKSPKDRLLRLSRESIRKELERLNSSTPQFNTQQNAPVSYMGISNLFTDNEAYRQKNVLSEKLNKIKNIKNKLSDENIEKVDSLFSEAKKQPQTSDNYSENKLFIIDNINEARNCISKYQYSKANEILFKILNMDSKGEFRIEICNLIAKNYDVLNEFELSLSYYEKAKEYALRTKDSRICEILCDIAKLNKKLYKMDSAKEQFGAIIANKQYSNKYRAIASLETGEIEEAQGNIKNASKHYENALALSLGNNKELTAKAYYKLAVLYDENGDTENAVKYYKKNYILSSEHYENKYYSISLTNLASIYMEQSRYKEASEFLQLALSYDSEIDDFENMYYSQKELARLYSNIDTKTAVSYYKQALNSAKELKDNFKSALVYFEEGELYYDKGEDEKALGDFFRAKKILGNNPKDENIIRINSRIKDIKMRMSNVNFHMVADEFENG